jgi:hypothetical protein
VLNAALNPEHATTRYRFEYAPCESSAQTLAECGHVESLEGESLAQYGVIEVAKEARNLAPSTAYAFRLVANNEHEEDSKVQGGVGQSEDEGHFVTAAPPQPAATTGPPSSVESTSAVISGAVNPGGQPASYSFELGVDEGAEGRLATVASGIVGAVAEPVPESLRVIGLQPGTAYVYRIVVKSGYGSAAGATQTFTTVGLPQALEVASPVGMLPAPPVAFPPPQPVIKPLSTHEKLVHALRICRRKKSPHARALCEKRERKRYAKRSRSSATKHESSRLTVRVKPA